MKNSASTTFPELLKLTKRELELRLARLLKSRMRLAKKQGAEVEAMVAEVESLCARGGKRFRPALLVMGALCAKSSSQLNLELLFEAGVSLELLQAYFLLHDDWMDQDELRRGGKTAHVSLAQRFGDTHLGAGAAILAGDYAVALASHHLASLPIKPLQLPACMSCFAEMQLAAVAGQELDLIGETNRPLLTYELKTASYTVAGPLQLGALLAGGKPELLRSLGDFAKPAGIAFQLRDDQMGAFGSPEATGKPRGSDLSAGKRTLLLEVAHQSMSPAQKKAVLAVWGKREASEKQLSLALSALAESGAPQAIERRINKLEKQALLALEQPGLRKEGRELLQAALTALIRRES